jgi:hypothetical protein
MPVFGKRKPAFQLSGLIASPDGLYDGSFVIACARWWNHEVENRKALRAGGYRPFDADEVRRLCGVVQSGNREAFADVAESVSLPGRHPAAVLSLAYAFALVIDAGAAQPRDERSDGTSWVGEQPRPFTADDLTELSRHYSEEGAAHEYELWSPYWMAVPTVFEKGVGEKVVASLRSAFDDQVDRWAAAEGDDLRRSIGPIDYSLVAFREEQNAGFANFVELLFEWGGRLRLGERFLAEGDDLVEARFGQIDETGFIDHLYAQTFERFVALASNEDPVEPQIVDAVEFASVWLAKGNIPDEQLWIATVAKRGYLWRRAHDRVAYHFMEPELSEAVEASRTVGDDRSPNEPYGVTLYFAASECIAQGVNTRLGSVGGMLAGPKAYEKAFYDTTDDLAAQGHQLDEQTKRIAFQFGVGLADVEHVLSSAYEPDPDE